MLSTEEKSTANAVINETAPTDVFVNNLTRNVKVGHLEEIFGNYGKIKNVKLEYNKGSAFITYEKSNDAEEAVLYMDGGKLDGEILKVSILLNKSKATGLAFGYND